MPRKTKTRKKKTVVRKAKVTGPSFSRDDLSQFVGIISGRSGFQDRADAISKLLEDNSATANFRLTPA